MKMKLGTPVKAVIPLLRLGKSDFRPHLCSKFSSAATATPTGFTTIQKDDPDYFNAKPFSDIPGPRGLPYVGTLHQYRLGKSRIKTFSFQFQFLCSCSQTRKFENSNYFFFLQGPTA